MNNDLVNADSVKWVIQSVLGNPVPNVVLGISCGYTIDSGDFNYIRATIHATDIFNSDADKLEINWKSSFL